MATGITVAPNRAGDDPAAITNLRTQVVATSASKDGRLRQLPGKDGCIGDKSARSSGCTTGRGLTGPGPFMGSRAIALSPHGAHAYVASFTSNALAVLKRNPKTGVLTQATGTAGCVANKAAQGCRRAVGLDGPNSVAVSQDGRNVYATARNSGAVVTFRRDRTTGALRQVGCVSKEPIPGCDTGIALTGADVVVASKDGENVYVGAFFADAIAAFARSDTNGALTQLSGSAACIAEATSGCTSGIALKQVEGLAISNDGSSVYAGTAKSGAVVVLDRDPAAGALSQSDPGCVTDTPLTGCTIGRALTGVNAVALSPDGRDLYATALLSSSVTSFTRYSDGSLTQKTDLAGCAVNRAPLASSTCRYVRHMSQPEGLVVTPDGRNVYVTAYKTGAVAVFDRDPNSGAVLQKRAAAACIGAPTGCTKGRALAGASSAVVSPDGRFVYVTAFDSNAVVALERCSSRCRHHSGGALG
jgi:DNA-binding beta-propeller fold protein YncE